MNKNNITVIIATKNRSKKIEITIKSLLNSTIMPLEIIIVDQSNNSKTKKTVINFKNEKLIYFNLNSKGKSKSLNFAIKKAKGQLLAFTDDDCIVDERWIENINKIFIKNNDISLCFGKTLPFQPNKNKDKISTCTFKKNPDIFSVIDAPCKHWLHVGFGNNMVIKADTLVKIGLFKKWLGPGSIGSNAEDAEIINRSLISGHKIGYNPLMIVFHDKWLNQIQIDTQIKSYDFGKIMSYGYFSFQGHAFAKIIIADTFKELNFEIKKSFKQISKLKTYGLILLYETMIKLFLTGKALVISYYYHIITN